MLKYFKCDQYVSNYLNIDIEKLKSLGIKLVFCDIDNTLVPHFEAHPTADALTFIERLKSNGFIVVLISNNKKNRVETFSSNLDVEYSFSSKKPLLRAFRRILNKYNLKPSEVCVIGDQLFTDILSARRMNAHAILVKPQVESDILITKPNRILESVLFKLFERKKWLKKGVYDDEQ